MGCEQSTPAAPEAAMKPSKPVIQLPNASKFLNPSIQQLQNILPTKTIHKGLQTGAHHLRNIFAIPLDLVDQYGPLPSHAKTPAEASVLRAALKQNEHFGSAPNDDWGTMINAFEPCEVEKGAMIIQQGDLGDYFYVIMTGSVEFQVDGKTVGTASSGASFGDLALLYNCPRGATVVAVDQVKLMRLHQTVFRRILRTQAIEVDERRLELLQGISFLKDVSPYDLNRLAQAMQVRLLEEGKTVARRGDESNVFLVLDQGKLRVTNIVVGNKSYADATLGPGDQFGGLAITRGLPVVGDVTVVENARIFQIPSDSFQDIVGDLDEIVTKTIHKTQLGAIKAIKDSRLDHETFGRLSHMVKRYRFKAGHKILIKGEPARAALYMIRSGSVEIDDGTATKQLGAMAYFADEMLLLDVGATSGKRVKPIVTPAYSVTATEETVCGVLTLESCRAVFDTAYLGKAPPNVGDSLQGKDVSLEALERHRILGAGTFGQVWLVSRTDSAGEKHAYALKVQSKYELIHHGQARAVVHEKNIMAHLRHPFITNLVSAFQDKDYVYMLMGLVQGGELYSVMHTRRSDHLPEEKARFYIAGIAEGLAYMHRRGYVYRDLKPENVMIDDEGYPVIVDFGFAKYVTSMTYTLCGTPLYLAPEVILSRGHNWGADHWSLGVLAYEMCKGGTPFYTHGMDQAQLFQRIIKCKWSMPRGISAAYQELLRGFICNEPSRRLGSLAGGEDDILGHPFFESIDFEELRLKTIRAPYVPNIKDPLDASNFEDWSHLDNKLQKAYPELTDDQNALFQKF